MALFDDAMFAPQSGIPGWLGELLKMAAVNPTPSQGFDDAQLPANSQPTMGQMPPQMAPAYQPPQGETLGLLSPQQMQPQMMQQAPQMMPQMPQQAQQQQMPQQPLLGQGGSLQRSLYEIAGALNPQLRYLNQGSNLTDDLKEYSFARRQGYNKSFTDYLRDKKAGSDKPTIVAPGSVVLGPDNKPIYTAPKEQTKTDLEKRAEAAGLSQGSQEYKDFMLRGGRNADAPLSATDKKAVFAAEDELPKIENTITALDRALSINDKTFSGFGASTLGTIGNKVPGGSMFVDPARARATQEWEKIMGPEALQTMANTLKGATTDFELNKFIEMLADPATDPAIRKSVLQRMKLLAERQRQVQTSRVNDLRGGTYFKPGGGGSQATSVPAVPQGSSIDDLVKKYSP